MTSQHDFLIEIGTEELPPKSLKRLAQAFADQVSKGFNDAELNFDKVKWFATPRRLAVMVTQLDSEQADKQVERRGPALKAAYDQDGKPTKAALGFAKSCGVDISDVQTLETDKGTWLNHSFLQTGKTIQDLAPAIVATALKRLPIPKPMRWGDNTVEFIRPVHWVVMLYQDTCIDAEILGIKTSNQTVGHRFHAPEAIIINKISEYEKLLATTGHVIADFEKRKAQIKDQVINAAKTVEGVAVISENLLDEVAGLVEWPIALVGHFEERFLTLPPEVLITTLAHHQKCFHVTDAKNNLSAHFVTVSNIKSQDPKQVIVGNQRVVRARLSDAEFFYKTDTGETLENRIDALTDVVFQAKLGSLYEKTTRVAGLAEFIAKEIKADHSVTHRAGMLAKTDLLTNMVGEFPELQGLMGYYYALQDKEPESVAIALKEQYLPKFAGDVVPQTKEGCALAIADRIDNLVGNFGVNQIPTGEKDPFGLRRAALGVIRIMIECKLDLDLNVLLTASVTAYKDKIKNKDTATQLYQFITERMRAWYAEQAVSADSFAAVLAKKPSRLLDFDQRIQAVTAFRALPEASALAQANKRVSNILSKQDKQIINGHDVNPKLLTEQAEKELASAITLKAKALTPLFQSAQYTEALTELASLREPVDKFFDEVMVMVDDEKIRENRLVLLAGLRQLFLQIADISLLQ